MSPSHSRAGRAAAIPDRVQSLTLVGQGSAPRKSFDGRVEMGRPVVESDERTAEQEASLNLYSGSLMGYPPLLGTVEDAKALDLPLLVVIGEDDERVGIAENPKSSHPAAKLIVAPGYDYSGIIRKDSPLGLSIIGFLEMVADEHRAHLYRLDRSQSRCPGVSRTAQASVSDPPFVRRLRTRVALSELVPIHNHDICLARIYL